jgi:mono/diheme cytochrome c family protein
MTHAVSIRSGLALAALLTACGLHGCTPNAAPVDDSSSGNGTGAGGSSATSSGGSPGSNGTGGRTATGGGGGTGSGGRAGSSSGGSAGTNGSGGTTGMSGSGGSGMDGGPSSGTDGATAPFAAVPQYAVCSVCHGPEGEGTDKGPEIQHPVVDFSTWVIRNGRMHPNFVMPMPKYAPDQLSDAQVKGILDYLAARAKPTTGAALYKDYCQNCHGADAKGGVTMRNIADKPVTKFLDDVRKGHHPGEFVNRREFMPKWSAAELSDAEIRLIFMHVDGL